MTERDVSDALAQDGDAMPGERSPQQKEHLPKTVVITGASSGLGRATAHAFARRGDRVALLARGRAGLEAASREVTELGGTPLALCIDVTDPDQVEAAAEEIEEAFGPPDVWINIAGATVFAPFQETPPSEYRRVTEVTYLGTVYGTLAALRRMVARDSGVIVQVASARAARHLPLQAAYGGASQAVRAFTESVRSELLHERSRVRLTLVELPSINTPRYSRSRSRLASRPRPLPPVYQPDVIAEAICYSVDQGRQEVSFSEPLLKEILARVPLPEFVERFLADQDWSGQLTNEPEDPERPDNLWEPLDDDPGIAGYFDDSEDGDQPGWLSRHRLALAAGALTAFGVLALFSILTGTRRPDDETWNLFV